MCFSSPKRGFFNYSSEVLVGAGQRYLLMGQCVHLFCLSVYLSNHLSIIHLSEKMYEHARDIKVSGTLCVFSRSAGDQPAG